MAVLYDPSMLIPLLPGGARAPAPKGYRQMKAFNFTLHHILPYRYACLVGLILIDLHAQRPVPAALAARQADLQALVKRLLADEYHTVDLGAVQPAQVPHLITRFGWMGPNLFMGPEGSWRLDDPKHAPEARRPASFSRLRWDALMTLLQLLDARFTFDETAGGCRVRSQMRLDDDGDWIFGGSGLLMTLVRVGVTGENVPHDFDLADWVVVESDETAWRKKQLALNNDDVKVGEAREHLLQLVASGKAEMRRPTSLTRKYDDTALQKLRADQASYRDQAERKADDADLARRNKKVEIAARKTGSTPFLRDPVPEGLGNLRHLFGDEKPPTDMWDDYRTFWRLKVDGEPTGSYRAIEMNFRVGGQAKA